MEPTLDDHLLTIGELAKRSRTPATTIRYYEREGLLPAPERLNGRRRYDHEADRQARRARPPGRGD
jgi:DNA-binding transcriptional MerR regulator